MPSSYHARFSAAATILVGTLPGALAAPRRAAAQAEPHERSPLAGDASFGLTVTDDTRESSVYFKLSQEFRLRVNETTDLSQRLSYSPRPENLSDYLIQGSLTLTTKVWKLLGIKTEISDDYDSTPFIDPDTGIARSSNDLTFITGLSVSF